MWNRSRKTARNDSLSAPIKGGRMKEKIISCDMCKKDGWICISPLEDYEGRWKLFRREMRKLRMEPTKFCIFSIEDCIIRREKLGD